MARGGPGSTKEMCGDQGALRAEGATCWGPAGGLGRAAVLPGYTAMSAAPSCLLQAPHLGQMKCCTTRSTGTPDPYVQGQDSGQRGKWAPGDPVIRGLVQDQPCCVPQKASCGGDRARPLGAQQSPPANQDRAQTCHLGAEKLPGGPSSPAALHCPILTRSPLMPMSPLNPGKPSSPWTRDGREGLSPRGSPPHPRDSLPASHGPLPTPEPVGVRTRGPSSHAVQPRVTA